MRQNNKYQHELQSMESEIAELKGIIEKKEEKIRDLLSQLVETQRYVLQLQNEQKEVPVLKLNLN